MRRSGRPKNDDSDDNLMPPVVPRDGTSNRNSNGRTSTRTFAKMMPDSVAAPPADRARLHQHDDILEQKRQAASGHRTAIFSGASAMGAASAAAARPAHSRRARKEDEGCQHLQGRHREQHSAHQDFSTKHQSSVPNAGAASPGAVAVPGSVGARDTGGGGGGGGEEMEEATPYGDAGDTNWKQGVAEEDVTNKNPRGSQLVQHVLGPNVASEEDMERDSHSHVTTSAGLAIAAEIAPDQHDVEAQVQARVHQEREEIVNQVQKRLLGEAVQANVVAPGDFPDDKPPPIKKWRNWFIIFGLLAIVVVVVVVLVVVLMVGKDSGSPDGSSTTEPPSPTPPPTAETPTVPVDSKCTLCADASIPEALESLTLGGDGITCANFMESQAEFELSSDACVQGQAEAWRFCDCPTLPPLPENATCSLCTDVSIPLGNPEGSFENKTCSAWNTFMAHVGSSESECTELQAGLTDVVEFCNCLSEPTFLQFLTNLLFSISGDVMLEEGTSQNHALNWLATQDPANLTASASAEELEQRYILAVLYFATGGSSWERNYGFLSIADVCSWNDGDRNGVFCTSGAISKIELDSNNLAGTLPDEITSLTSLVTIEMSNNLLVGTMPQSIGDLMAIQGFSIYQNAMTGTLPASFFNIQTLKVLWLDKNLFSGVLPLTIGNAKALDWFSCPECSLNGTIPASIGSLSNLRVVDLQKNDLNGAVPSFVGNNRLEDLVLNDNKLTGTLPSTLGNLARLQRVFLQNNNLTGTIPRSVGDLQSLTTISFSGNSLTGDIPPFKSELINQIFLYNNELTGTLDDFFNSSAPAALTVIRFEENKLTGTLPEAIGNFVQLEEFLLMQNQLDGTIPSTLGNLINVRLLAIGQNNLNGTLPSSLGNLSKVEWLDFDVNFLTGTLPRSIGALPSLSIFDVHQNSLVGDIPPFTGQQISEVWLYGNLLTGGLDEFFNSSSSAALKMIRFEENRLSGSLPDTIGNFLQLEEFQLNENLLNGPIPSSLGNLVNAIRIRFNEAGVTGPIPTELGKLTKLINLDLGVNALSGTVPSELGNCESLAALGFALCGLSGSFPSGVANLPVLEDLLVHGNDFTNDFDETFCARADNIDRLTANCLDPTLDCTCCTHCCTAQGLSCVEQP